MGFFDVGDGEAGTAEDRIAIICIVAFAFCWIPIFIIWKLITVMRRKDGDAEAGNVPVTTHNSDPEKNPYHPVAAPNKREQSSTTRGPTSIRNGERRASTSSPSRPSRDGGRRASRGDRSARDATNRENFDSATEAAQRLNTRKTGAPSRTHRSQRVNEPELQDVRL